MQETSQDKEVKVKIPPIVIQTKLDDPTGLLKAIKENIDPEVKFQFLTNGTKKFLNNKGLYKELEAKLKEDKIEFHTYSLEDDMCKHLVLKGIYNSKAVEVEQEIKEKGFTPLRCIQMKHKKEKANAPPFFMLTFDKDTNINEVRKIRYISSVVIRWEKYKNSRKVTQCHRCQQFGHGSRNCHKSPKCVKCAGDHLTKICLKTEAEKPKCANCSEEHPANYSKCTKYLEKLSYIEKIRTPKQKKNNVQKIPNTTDFPETLEKKDSEKTQVASAWDNKNNKIRESPE